MTGGGRGAGPGPVCAAQGLGTKVVEARARSARGRERDEAREMPSDLWAPRGVAPGSAPGQGAPPLLNAE